MFDFNAAISAVSATLRRVPAAPPAHPESEPARERLLELRREVRERRGVEAALRSSQSDLKSSLSDCQQEREYLLEQNTRLEEQLCQAQKMAALGRLAGGVSHDFNNVLGVIAGNAELLLRQLDAASPHRRRVEQLLQAAHRGTGLTRQLLTFSRKTSSGPKALDLAVVVADMQGMLEQMIGEDVRLGVSAEDGLGVVKADPGRIEQILMNLAVNARDAMPRGGELQIHLANDDRHVCLDVSDNGCGMDEETLARAFEPFFTTKDAHQGTGLGLATVHDIVTQSGGEIAVESTRGRGTTFRLRFPRVDEPAPRPEPVASSPSPAAAGGRETILLVEDEEFLRELVAEALTDAGYVVICAASGSDALQKANAHAGPIDMTLTDVVMPGMTGHELTQRLAPLRPAAQVLYMSGYTEDDITRRGLIEPGAPLMPKPFTSEILLEQVRGALTRSTRCGTRTETSLAAQAHRRAS
jgi:two-component system, cell cycle sensor histidine kinase and response regulator CckA